MATESTRSTAATDLADAIEAMAARLQHDPTEILNEVAEGAVAAVPRAIGALIAERRADGQLHEVASAGQVPRDFISVQNELGAGPLTSVMAEGSLLVVEDASNDPRWPSFASSAVRGLLCAPLALGGRLIGALSLISSGVDGFDNESEDMAVIFAAHAAVSLAGTHRENQLALARDSRDLIGQAKGILMERFRVTDPVAFALLVRISKELNQKLAAVALHLCTTGQLLGTGHPPRRA